MKCIFTINNIYFSSFGTRMLEWIRILRASLRIIFFPLVFSQGKILYLKGTFEILPFHSFLTFFFPFAYSKKKLTAGLLKAYRCKCQTKSSEKKTRVWLEISIEKQSNSSGMMKSLLSGRDMTGRLRDRRSRARGINRGLS